MSISAMMQSTANYRTVVLRGRQPDEQLKQSQVAKATSNTVEQLTRYVPTEVVTVYVALIGAMQEAQAGMNAKWVAFWIILLTTPIVAWLLLAAKLRANGMDLPIKPSEWPWWKAIAASIAFTAWAFALPQGPFSSLPWYSGSYGSVAIVATTALLGLVGSINDPIKTREI